MLPFRALVKFTTYECFGISFPIPLFLPNVCDNMPEQERPFCVNLMVCFSCSFNIALWPVWSFFTPLILFTQFMGVVMFISLLG